MRRYFMLMTEAVHLVLHAARLARGGELFVLDMGEQISVVEMARNLIRLSGFIPDKDIAMTYLGCRPGEKLVEELVGDHETLEATSVPKISCVRKDSAYALSNLSSSIRRLEESAAEGNASALLAILCDILPDYRPWGGSHVHQGMGDSRGTVPADLLSSPVDVVTIAGLSPAASRRRG